MIALVKRTTISRKLQLLGMLFVVGYVGLGACAYSLVSAVKINGPLYKTIADGKDLVAEVMPPPESLIESYLVVLQMVDETDASALSALAEQSKKLRAVYEAVWGVHLDSANFRRSVLAEDGWVIPTGRRAQPGSSGGKPPELYRAGRMWKQGGPIRYPQPAERRRGNR